MIENTHDDRTRMTIEHKHMMMEQPMMKIDDPMMIEHTMMRDRTHI